MTACGRPARVHAGGWRVGCGNGHRTRRERAHWKERINANLEYKSARKTDESSQRYTARKVGSLVSYYHRGRATKRRAQGPKLGQSGREWGRSNRHERAHSMHQDALKTAHNSLRTGLGKRRWAAPATGYRSVLAELERGCRSATLRTRSKGNNKTYLSSENRAEAH